MDLLGSFRGLHKTPWPLPQCWGIRQKMGQGFVGDDSACSGQQALLGRSICSKGGHGIDILLQRSEVLLSIYSLLLGWRSHGPPLTSGLHSLD